MAEVEREAALLASAAEPARCAPGSAEATPLSRLRRRRARAAAPGARRAGLRAAGGRRRARRRAVRRRRRAHGRLRVDAAAGLGGARGSTTTARSSSPTASRRRPRARSTWSGSSAPGGAPEPTSALFTPRRDGSATASRDRRPRRRRDRAGQHRAARRLDDADLRARPDRRAQLSAIASRPRTSNSSANSKRSSASPAIRSSASRVSVGNSSGGSEREVVAELAPATPARSSQALLVGERADVEREHVGRVGDHPRRQRRGRQHGEVALEDRQRVRARRDAAERELRGVAALRAGAGGRRGRAP